MGRREGARVFWIFFVGFKRHRGGGGVRSGNQLLGLLLPVIRSVECLQKKKKTEKVYSLLDRKMEVRGRGLFSTVPV